MKHGITFFLMLALLVVAHGQPNFRPATIQKSSGETLTGYIDYRNWDENPKSVVFKGTGGKEIKLGVGDITHFEVKREDNMLERYQKAILEIDVSPSKTEDLDYQPLPSFVGDTVFLLTLVEGKVSLFYLRSERRGGIHFFVKGADGETVELVQKDYRLPGNTSIITNNQFRLKLLKLSEGCAPESLPSVYEIKYQRAPLMEYVEKLNACLDGKSTYQWKDEKAEISPYVFAGASNARLLSEAMFSSAILKGSKYAEWDLGLVLGLGVSYVLPRTNGKARFSGELAYSRVAPRHISIKQNTVQDYRQVSTLGYALQYLQFNMSTELTLYKGKKLSTYLKFGGLAGYLLKREFSQTELRTKLSTGKVLINQHYGPSQGSDVRTYALGFFGGVGVYFPKPSLSLELCNSVTNGYSELVNVTTTVQYLNFVVGYHW